jgi:hypothetical protein
MIPGIERAPIFNLSLHGSYDIAAYESGKIPMEIPVPADMIIIETANIGSSCYFTNFKEAMEPLFLDRPRLLLYMNGTPPEDDTPELRQKRAKAISSCHIYLPGAKIANRILTQETGRRAGFHANGTPRTEGARTSDYGKHMTFSRYDVAGGGGGGGGGAASVGPKLILERVRSNLIGKADAPGGAHETYETMIGHLRSLGDEGLKILVFPVCGTIDIPKPKGGVKVHEATIRAISALQMAADTAWSGLIGRSLRDVSEAANAAYKGPIGVGTGGIIAGRDPYSRYGPVPGGRRRTHRRKSKKTRRFLKKSKRTLKRRASRAPRALGP